MAGYSDELKMLNTRQTPGRETGSELGNVTYFQGQSECYDPGYV